MNWILFRYLSWRFVKNFLFLMMALLALVYLFDTLELLRRAAKKEDIPLTITLQMGLFKLPDVGQQLIPFAILFSSMATLWQLGRAQELVIMRAAGFSVWHFLTPLFVAAMIIGCLYVSILHPLSSVLLSRYQQMQSEYLGQTRSLVTISEEGLWLKEVDARGEIIVYADKVSLPDWTLDSVMALYMDEEGNNYQRIDANRARLMDGYWQFEEALRHQSDRVGDNPLGVRSVYSLQTDLTLEELRDSFSDPATISFWNLPAFIRTLKLTGFPATSMEIYYQDLLAKPLLMAAMVLIGAVVSLRPPRSQKYIGFLMAGVLAGFFVFFLANFLKALGASHQIPVFLAAWSPPFICIFVGLSILVRTEDG